MSTPRTERATGNTHNQSRKTLERTTAVAVRSAHKCKHPTYSRKNRQRLRRTYIFLSTTARISAPHQNHRGHTSGTSGSTTVLLLSQQCCKALTAPLTSVGCWLLHVAAPLLLLLHHSSYVHMFTGSRFLVFLLRSEHICDDYGSIPSEATSTACTL